MLVEANIYNERVQKTTVSDIQRDSSPRVGPGGSGDSTRNRDNDLEQIYRMPLEIWVEFVHDSFEI